MIKMGNKKIKCSVSGMLFLGIILFMGCGSPRQTTTDLQNFDQLKNLVNKQDFTIEFQWAQPQGGGLIDLMTNPNFMRFKGEEVDIFLPYFGVRHSGGGYGSNTGGIKYKGKISNLSLRENPSKQNILMKFEGKQDTEWLEFNVTFYTNGKAQAIVSSSERSNISYQGGDVKPTPSNMDR